MCDAAIHAPLLDYAPANGFGNQVQTLRVAQLKAENRVKSSTVVRVDVMNRALHTQALEAEAEARREEEKTGIGGTKRNRRVKNDTKRKRRPGESFNELFDELKETEAAMVRKALHSILYGEDPRERRKKERTKEKNGRKRREGYRERPLAVEWLGERLKTITTTIANKLRPRWRSDPLNLSAIVRRAAGQEPLAGFGGTGPSH